MSRKGATMRFVEEEDWLRWRLREEVEKRRGWRFVVHTGNEPLAVQIAKFHQADIVVGPHGSATSNVLFCRGGSAVVEFPGNKHRGDSTNGLAAAAGVEYWIVPEVWTTNWGYYKMDRHKIESVVEVVGHLMDARSK